MYKIGSGTHSAPLAHNKKIKSTALDIRQPAAVQQSISYLTILALSKIQQTKMLVTCQMFGDLFLFGLIWQYSANQNQYNEGRFKVMATYLQQ